MRPPRAEIAGCSGTPRRMPPLVAKACGSLGSATLLQLLHFGERKTPYAATTTPSNVCSLPGCGPTNLALTGRRAVAERGNNPVPGLSVSPSSLPLCGGGLLSGSSGGRGKQQYMIAVGHRTGVVLLRLEAHSKRKVRFLLSTVHVQRLLSAALLLGGSQQIGACTVYAPVRLCRTRQACVASFFEETTALIVGRKL
jgi:hypothetical protein